MNSKYISALIIGILIIGGGIYFLSGQSSNSVTNTKTSNSTADKPAPIVKDPTAVSAPSPVVHNISITGFAFSPASITVRKGETIIWTNKDSVPHTVTGGTNGDINSLSLAQNQTYSFAFDKTGTFFYYCKIHPSMKGTLIVTN